VCEAGAAALEPITTMKRLLAPILLLTAAAACGPEEADDPTFCAIPLDDAPLRGLDDAPVKVVEFADFECPFCRSVEPTLVALLDERPDTVALVFKHAPSGYHAQALPAALAAVCAGEQGLFWEMHDELLAPTASLDDAALAAHAESVGVDVDGWRNCLDSDAAYATVEGDLALAVAAGVTGTPTFFVNGRALVGAASLETFRDLVDDAADAAVESGLAPDEYYAELQRSPCR
jgi:protein-disulfide isomerase